MLTFTINEAQTQLVHLIEAVTQGEQIIIARAGNPVAQLTACPAPRHKIAPPGGMEGEIRMSDNFDDPIDELFDCLKEDDEKPTQGG
ncbi:MAG: type II toxin-antitoxin system prevent-host-death family antitoxin [Gammaproteobacteria bacterium]|nr:type II toxin-antitoxin system prevent-host-death family antitoxin [Gammaproteobacteria bacterium]NNJ84558.1 type II toxin-antitoxin system prevent-host-death family antitoxin [Gammaproteobacteria bacterium]